MSERSATFEAGLEVRKAVLGEEYVNNGFKNATDFSMDLQNFTTEHCWGALWTRPYLERKQRSLINIAMLCALGRNHELKLHIRGAIRNGCSKEEIREALLHSAVYAGIPSGVEGFRVAQEAFDEHNE